MNRKKITIKPKRGRPRAFNSVMIAEDWELYKAEAMASGEITTIRNFCKQTAFSERTFRYLRAKNKGLAGTAAKVLDIKSTPFFAALDANPAEVDVEKIRSELRLAIGEVLQTVKNHDDRRKALSAILTSNLRRIRTAQMKGIEIFQITYSIAWKDKPATEISASDADVAVRLANHAEQTYRRLWREIGNAR